jgi:hypothetical protein
MLDLSTTYGISVFVGFLAVSRVIALQKDPGAQRAGGGDARGRRGGARGRRGGARGPGHRHDVTTAGGGPVGTAERWGCCGITASPADVSETRVFGTVRRGIPLYVSLGEARGPSASLSQTGPRRVHLMGFPSVARLGHIPGRGGRARRTRDSGTNQGPMLSFLVEAWFFLMTTVVPSRIEKGP